MMNKINKSGSIYIYIIFLLTILLTFMAFLSKYVMGNLEIYHSIEKYFISYGDDIGNVEEIIISYYDNPKNLNYIDTKKFDKNKNLSKFKEFIEYTLDAGESYEISLTSFDEEYNDNLNSLKFIDLYWGTNDNRCDLNLSIIRWEKTSINTISNNKKKLNYLENRSLLYATGSNDNKLYLTFTTGAYYNSGNLGINNFILNNNIISGITGSGTNYNLTLNSNINTSTINTILIKNGEIKDINGNIFDSDILNIKIKNNIYKNRFRITDSFGSIDKTIYDYKVIINSNNLCSFYLEGFDSKNNLVKLPDKKILGEVKDSYNKSQNIISKKIKIGNIELSNYLYKLY